MGYASLTAVKQLLQIDDSVPNPNRDALLNSLNDEVTAGIEDGLGRKWSGLPPTASVRQAVAHPRTTMYLPSLAQSIISVTVDGTTVTGTDTWPVITDAVTGDIAAIARHDGWNWAGSTTLADVEAIWSDDAGGDPPTPIVSFANWAVAQLWRRRQAGSGGMLGPEGYTVTVDDPWRSNDWATLRRSYRIRPLPLI